MIKLKYLSLIVLTSTILQSCVDHDGQQLSPIYITQVIIMASVKDTPNTTWLNVTEEPSISVSDVKMNATKGVVLRSLSLVANIGFSKYVIDDKPFSGEPMVFKIPLSGMSYNLTNVFGIVGSEK